MKKTVALLATFFFAIAGAAFPAQAEIFFFKDLPGWTGAEQPDGAYRIIRDDRAPTALGLYAYPADKEPVTSQEAAIKRIREITMDIAGKRKKCAALANAEAKPNGMGFEIKDSPEATKCFLFIGATKDGRLFANLWLDDGAFEQKSQPFQQSARLFFQLAVARIEGKPIKPGEGAQADLKKIAALAPADNLPERLVVAYKEATYFSSEKYKAIPIIKSHAASNCANWDPVFYAPEDLAKAGRKSSLLFDSAPCRLFAWKRSAQGDDILLFNGKTWAPVHEFDALNILDIDIEPFTEGEKLLFMSGDKNRLFPVVKGQDIKTLRSGDAMFTPDGRFLAGDLGLAAHPHHLPRQSSGRYYLNGHIIVVELDNGPVLIGLAGKVMENGAIKRLFIGGASFEAAP